MKLKHLCTKFKYFGWFNLNSSNKMRLIKQNYYEIKASIMILPLVKEVLADEKYEFNFKNCEGKLSNTIQKPILFQYWHQGFNNLPPVVINCYKSVDYYLKNDFNIIRLEYRTLANYISLPLHIYEKLEKNMMTIAHFSDIVRNKLLLDYGGLWLDSTVLLTDNRDVKKFIDKKNISFQNRNIFSNSKEHAYLIDSWMIWSLHPGEKIFNLTQRVLELYWKKNSEINNYFLYHIIISNLIRENPNLIREIDFRRKNYCPNSLDLLFFWLDKKFDNTEFLFLLNICSIHKLNHKIHKETNLNLQQMNFSHLLYDEHLFGKEFWDNWIK